MKYVLLVVLIFFLFALIAPKRVPRLLRKAGRSARTVGRLAEEIASGEEVDDSPLARYEAKAGSIVELKVLADHPPAQDEVLQEEVRAIGARLAEHAARRQIAYRFTVVESDAPNAFAVPGGAVFITRPLVELCDRDADRIACVLGHEVAHIDRKHAVRSLAATAAARSTFWVLTLGRGAMLARMAGGMQQLLVQGYRQDQELEADSVGVRLAKRAGFDPAGLIALLERIGELQPDGSGPLAEIFQYFRSHPPVAARIAALRREIGGK